MNLTKVSKLLSLILRHKPEEIGLGLDKNGWADVIKLINGVSTIYPEFNLDILEEIVRTDEKHRYSFNDDKTKIRANQGHSIPVDLELSPVEPPEYLYHGTGTKYMGGIWKEGIMSKSRQFVHLSGDIPTAINVGKRHGEPAVVYIRSGEMYEDGYVFYKSMNGVWLTDHIPTKYIMSVTIPVEEKEGVRDEAR